MPRSPRLGMRGVLWALPLVTGPTARKSTRAPPASWKTRLGAFTGDNDDHLLAVRGDEKLGGRPCAQYFVGSRTVLVDRVTQIAETICEHDHAVFTGRRYDCSGAVAIKDAIPSTSE